MKKKFPDKYRDINDIPENVKVATFGKSLPLG